MYFPLTFNLIKTSHRRWALEAGGKQASLSRSEAKIFALIHDEPNIKVTVVATLIRSKSDRSVRNLINRMRKKFVRTFGDTLIPLTAGKGYRVLAKVRINQRHDAVSRQSMKE